jgi:hypothetical protein
MPGECGVGIFRKVPLMEAEIKTKRYFVLKVKFP